MGIKPTVIALFATMTLPIALAAQSVRPVSEGFQPLPPIGLPLPRIDLPLAPIGLPPMPASPTQRLGSDPRRVGSEPRSSRPRGERHRPSGNGKRFRSAPTALYFLPAYGWDYPSSVPPGTSAPSYPLQQEQDANAPTGRLQLEVEPAILVQLYVDGYFVGMSSDIGNELELEEGLHTVEIRAPGYQPFQLDVRIQAGRSITYRGTLSAVGAAPSSQPPNAIRENPPARPVVPVTPTHTPAPPQTTYFIPGCYLGNVPPQELRLPPSCDQSRLQTFKP